MITALPFLFVISLVLPLVLGINVPRSHSLVKRNPRFPVPRTLQDDLVARQLCDVDCTNGGCCEGSCCGNGCCPIGYFCDPVNGQGACCQDGEICGDQISGCTSTNLVPCANYEFCCPPGETCSLDGSGNAQCNGVSVGNDNGNTDGDGNETPTPTSTPESNPDTSPAASPTFTTPQFNTSTVDTNVLYTTTPDSTSIPFIPVTTSTTSNLNNNPTASSADTVPQSGAGRLIVDSAIVLVASLAGVMLL